MFAPPFHTPEKPEIDDYNKILEAKNSPNVKKYTDKEYNFGVAEVSFEESAMGKIHEELRTQNNEFRNFAAQQEINRNLDKKQANKDALKKTIRDCVLSIVSAVVGGIISNIYVNSGFSIIEFFKNLFH